jgi:hypothetical protein
MLLRLLTRRQLNLELISELRLTPLEPASLLCNLSEPGLERPLQLVYRFTAIERDHRLNLLLKMLRDEAVLHL